MGFTDAREPSKNAIFHGDGYLSSYVVVISVKVTYPAIRKGKESSRYSRHSPNTSRLSVASMREQIMCLLGRQLGKSSN